MGFAASHRLARISRGVAWLGLCLNWIAIAAPSTHAATWTILASRAEEAEKNAIDLLSVELSGIAGIEVVDRADVQSLLRGTGGTPGRYSGRAWSSHACRSFNCQHGVHDHSPSTKAAERAGRSPWITQGQLATPLRKASVASHPNRPST